MSFRFKQLVYIHSLRAGIRSFVFATSSRKWYACKHVVFVGSYKRTPELLAAQHVHQKICGWIYARKKIGKTIIRKIGWIVQKLLIYDCMYFKVVFWLPLSNEILMFDLWYKSMNDLWLMLIVLMSIYLMNLSMRGVDSQIGGCLWSDGNCIIGLQKNISLNCGIIFTDWQMINKIEIVMIVTPRLRSCWSCLFCKDSYPPSSKLPSPLSRELLWNKSLVPDTRCTIVGDLIEPS